MGFLVVVSVFLVSVYGLKMMPDQDVVIDVDWPQFLARADLVWDWDSQSAKPDQWYESAFHGNGALGLMAYWNDTIDSFRFELGRTDVYDDREAGMPYTVGNFAVDRPRLPIGFFSLITVGTFLNGTMRLSLYNGLTTSTIYTTEGVISLKFFTNARFDLADVHVIEINTTSGENNAHLSWQPEPAVSTWSNQVSNYIYNPAPYTELINGITVTTQMHLSGRSHATAFVQTSTTPGQQIYVISTSVVCDDGAAEAYLNVVNGVNQQPTTNLLNNHITWWNEYYSQTFLTFGNASYLESFYWIQMYKLASGAREGRDVFDLEGPWFIDGTDWPDLHWDMNLPFLYQVFYTGNRLDSGSTLIDYIVSTFPNMITNIPIDWQYDSAAAPTGASALDSIETCYWDYGIDPQTGACVTSSPSITGNLLWVLHNVYLHYEYSMNSTMLPEIYPMLRRAVNFYTHFIINGTDGFIHLPTTFSPEYPLRGPDTNYDLALLRWGLGVLLDLSSQLNEHDVNLPLWKDMLERLTPYPSTAFIGYNIGEGIPFNMSHRHFSHLFMVWPLMLQNLSDPSESEISTVSVDHWISLPSELTGFARPAVSTMNSRFAAFANPINITMRQQAAYSNITFVVNSWILPNTMYAEETDGACGETPPAIASAIQDWMLLSSQNQIIVFPGIDDSNVVDAAFHLLRASGGFLISSKRINGTTQFVRIVSEAGSHCVLMANIPSPWVSDPPIQINMIGEGIGEINITQGQTIIVYSSIGPMPNLTIQAAAGDPSQFNYWGVRSTSSLSSTSTQRLTLSTCDNAENQSFSLNSNTLRSLHDMSLCLTINTCEDLDFMPVVLKKCDSLSYSSSSTSSSCSSTNTIWRVKENGHIVNENGRCLIKSPLKGPEIVAGPCSNESIWHFDEKNGQVQQTTTSQCLTISSK